AGGTALPDAQASVAVNSLGLLDLVQIAAKGLAPKESYQVYLAESNKSPFGMLEPLAVLKINPDGAGIVQAIGPLKALAGDAPNCSPPQRFLIVTDIKDSSQVVLRQAKPQEAGAAPAQNPKERNNMSKSIRNRLTGTIEKNTSEKVVSEVVI